MTELNGGEGGGGTQKYIKKETVIMISEMYNYISGNRVAIN